MVKLPDVKEFSKAFQDVYGSMKKPKQKGLSMSSPQNLRQPSKYDAMLQCLVIVIAAAHFASKQARIVAARVFDKLSTEDSRTQYSAVSENSTDGPLTQALEILTWVNERGPMPSFLQRLTTTDGSNEANDLLK